MSDPANTGREIQRIADLLIGLDAIDTRTMGASFPSCEEIKPRDLPTSGGDFDDLTDANDPPSCVRPRTTSSKL
jgi:hypothetical protein